LVSLCEIAVVRLCTLPFKMTPRDILLMEVMMMRLLAGLLLSVMIASSQSPQPFTAVEVSRRFDGAGNLKSEARFLLAMNRDGSLVSVDLDPATGPVRQIIDVPNSRTLVVDPNTRTASVTPLGVSRKQSSEACDQRFRSIQGAAVTVEKSVATLVGVIVDRIRVDLPDGTSMQILAAPSLKCHMLDSTVRRNGAVVETHAVDNFRLQDPDPNLFTVPPEYRQTLVEFQKR
jgi:hypothetical protein